MELLKNFFGTNAEVAVVLMDFPFDFVNHSNFGIGPKISKRFIQTASDKIF